MKKLLQNGYEKKNVNSPITCKQVACNEQTEKIHSFLAKHKEWAKTGSPKECLDITGGLYTCAAPPFLPLPHN